MTNNDTSEAPSGHIDDLFDYDVGLDEILQDVATTSNTNAPKQPDPGLGLGLDEEVKVFKKRQPVAKLDESRLLSQRGIPKLRRAARTKLRFKGKGHEFSDAARLLNFYQLWLDDLFPRAKFADGLSMIEKLGHSKRLQTMRREWIDEEKSKHTETFESTLPERDLVSARNQPTGFHGPESDTVHSRSNNAHHSAQKESEVHNAMSEGLFMSDNDDGKGMDKHEPEGYDDLDTLLREQEDGSLTAPNKHPVIIETNEYGSYADDLEVLRELEDAS